MASKKIATWKLAFKPQILHPSHTKTTFLEEKHSSQKALFEGRSRSWALGRAQGGPGGAQGGPREGPLWGLGLLGRGAPGPNRAPKGPGDPGAPTKRPKPHLSQRAQGAQGPPLNLIFFGLWELTLLGFGNSATFQHFNNSTSQHFNISTLERFNISTVKNLDNIHMFTTLQQLTKWHFLNISTLKMSTFRLLYP